MRTIFSIIIVSLILLPMAGQSQSHNGLYSLTCSDWSAKGWGSKQECLEDGRWHEIHSEYNYDCAKIAQEVYNHRNLYKPGVEISIVFDDTKHPQIHGRDMPENGNEINFYAPDGSLALKLNQSGNINTCNLSFNTDQYNQFSIMIRY